MTAQCAPASDVPRPGHTRLFGVLVELAAARGGSRGQVRRPPGRAAFELRAATPAGGCAAVGSWRRAVPQQQAGCRCAQLAGQPLPPPLETSFCFDVVPCALPPPPHKLKTETLKARHFSWSPSRTAVSRSLAVPCKPSATCRTCSSGRPATPRLTRTPHASRLRAPRGATPACPWRSAPRILTALRAAHASRDFTRKVWRPGLPWNGTAAARASCNSTGLSACPLPMDGGYTHKAQLSGFSRTPLRPIESQLAQATLGVYSLASACTAQT